VARIIPPGTVDTVDVNHMCPYDPAKAKALLAEAGYGPQKPLTFELMTNTEKSVFSVIATVIKEQMARIGVTANIRLVDKPSWMVTSTQDGPFDMYVEDLASLLTVDQNSYLSATTAAWNHSRHTDTRIDDFYTRYAREMDPVKRKAIARELQEYSADKLYWNTISGSPFYQAAAVVDEGLRVPGRVQGHLQEGLAGQVGDANVHPQAAAADHSDHPRNHVRGIRHDAIDPG